MWQGKKKKEKKKKEKKKSLIDFLFILLVFILFYIRLGHISYSKGRSKRHRRLPEEPFGKVRELSSSPC